jgi:uncharacterized protein (DUF1810 family)
VPRSFVFTVVAAGRSGPIATPTGVAAAEPAQAWLAQAERRLEESASTVAPAQLAIRDLKLIDGTMPS